MRLETSAQTNSQATRPVAKILLRDLRRSIGRDLLSCWACSHPLGSPGI